MIINDISHSSFGRFPHFETGQEVKWEVFKTFYKVRFISDNKDLSDVFISLCDEYVSFEWSVQGRKYKIVVNSHIR